MLSHLQNLRGLFLSLCLCLCLLVQIGHARTVSVELSEVVAREIAQELQLIGTVESAESVGITSNVTERITQLFFEDGDVVKAGQILATLDAGEEEAELSEAFSVLEEAEQQFARLEPLVKKGASPKSTLDTAKQEVQSAKSRVKVIESRIAQHTIRAPFDGQLGVRQVSIGALVQPGQVLVFLDKIGDVKLRLAIPVAFVDQLNNSQVRLVDYPDKNLMKLTTKDSRIQSSQALWVYAPLEIQPESTFYPGLRLPALIEFDRQTATAVPETAVIFRGKQASIFIVDNDLGDKKPSEASEAEKSDQSNQGYSVTERLVNVGIRSSGWIQIESGAEIGEKVVSQGAQQLKTGDRVVHVDL